MNGSPKTFLRVASSGNGNGYIVVKLIAVIRRLARQMFADLCPNKLDGVQFGSINRKTVNMQSRMLVNECLYKFALMDGMSIPDQNDRAAYPPQQVLQEIDHFFAAQSSPVALNNQLTFTRFGRDQECPKQVEPLTPIQAGAYRVLPYPASATGVCPRGAQVRCSGALSENPLSSRKINVAPKSRHFFYLCPTVAFPVRDGFVVALQTLALRFLTTPADAPQQMPDTTRMVTHCK